MPTNVNLWATVYTKGQKPVSTVIPSISYGRTLIADGLRDETLRAAVQIDHSAAYVMTDGDSVVLESGLVASLPKA